MAKILLTSAQEAFFHGNGWILFEEFFCAQQVIRACTALLPLPSPSASRDRCFSQPAVASLVHWRKIAQVGAMLTAQESVSFGYDQLLTPQTTAMLPPPFSLEAISSVQPLLFGVLIALQPQEEHSEIFPRTTANICFLAPTLMLPTTIHGSYLLVAYARRRPFYVHNRHDPWTHALKQQGYAFGESLSRRTHPNVFHRTLT